MDRVFLRLTVFVAIMYAVVFEFSVTQTAFKK